MGDMDSGNSGSMQSSSTGGGGGGEDQEYDSRGGAAVFFNPAAAAISNFNLENMTPPLQLYSFSNNGSSSFAHHQVSNYFDHPPTLSQSSSLECSNFMLNHHNNGTNNNPNNNNNNNNQLDMVWPNKFTSIRPSISTDDANCTHHDGPLSYSITNNQQHQQQQQQQQQIPVAAQGPPTAPTNAGSSRNPKKRSRASRRAPTTVLTTDTSNFRQMVQEFTGIPAPPFTAFSTRTRFDIFGGLGGHSSSTTVPPPPYLLRPFPQKRTTLHQPSFLANSSLPSLTTTTTSTSNINNSNAALVDGIGLAPSTTCTGTNTSVSTTIAPPTTTAFQLCDPHEFLSTNNNNNNHPQLSFQSLLQPSSVAVTCTTATPHHTTCSVNPAGDALVNGRGTGTNGGATKGEGMVDSWICSSD